MENPGYITLSRQMVLRRQMDVIANNLANLNTPGYKGEAMLFVEHLKRTLDNEKISFVQDIAVVRNLSDGPMTRTGNQLDLSIRGEGYFVVETDEGERYTRAGNFTLDDSGQIATAQGHPVLGDGGAPIVIPPGSDGITITADGSVNAGEKQVGRIQVVSFENEHALRKLKDGLYDAGNQDPKPLEEVEIQQGMLEDSNVSGVLEMTKMINTVRSYQAAAKIAEDEHQRQRKAIEALVNARR